MRKKLGAALYIRCDKCGQMFNPRTPTTKRCDECAQLYGIRYKAVV